MARDAKKSLGESMEPNVVVFDRDAAAHGGYLYTAGNKLSSRLATQRTVDAILETGRLCGRAVLDMGCGDGYYTLQLYDRGHPRSIVAVDGSPNAIGIADSHKGNRPVYFAVGNVYQLDFPDNSFDLALLQSILHHVAEPLKAIREAFRLAPEILIHDPNGNNFGLKVIEKVSRYHREHHEKSYPSWKLKRWVQQAEGRIVDHRFAGFVPMFCPDWLARLMKAVEPIVEKAPLLNHFGCAVQVIVAARRSK